MERKIGEVFTYNGKTYQVVEVEIAEECKGCAFEFSSCCVSFLGDCSPKHRTDGTSVIYKEINNNMEIKNNQLTIDIPKGMEIDLENSNLAKGIVKFKKHDITYNDVLQACPTNFGGLRVRTHCIDKVLAISQLMNIAKFYNKDWDYNASDDNSIGYAIYYGAHLDNGGYLYNTINPQSSVYYGVPVFKNKEDVQAVIDNPNFRDILDAIYKN